MRLGRKLAVGVAEERARDASVAVRAEEHAGGRREGQAEAGDGARECAGRSTDAATVG